MRRATFLPAVFLPLALAQQPLYAQCGGLGWTGSTACVAGTCCAYQNTYYSQCLPSTSCSSSSSPSPSTAVASTAASTTTGTIHLCGDSTMASGGGGSGTQGWGEYLKYSFSGTGLTVSNSAIAGRSARSYTREGRFAAVAASAKSGDWVVVEFGHNDGGSLSTDNGRTDCFGDGTQTCSTTYNGVSEIVQTYPTYLKNATSLFLKAGAKVILSAPTPNNVWESGTYTWGPDRFAYYAWLAASQMGGPSAGVYYVPHGAYAAQAMKNMGADVVDANYPIDHTHTAPYLADVMARAFVLGLKCGTSDLGKRATNSTASLTSTFLGQCIAANSTLPI